MPTRHEPMLIAPDQVLHPSDGNLFPFEFFERHGLAQGDSWFSIGAVPPMATTRILTELRLKHTTVIVNCAQPGKRLSRVVDTWRAPQFRALLTGRLAQRWHVILLSGGGNDLIAKVGTRPSAPQRDRLLRTPKERGPSVADPAGYLCEPGWRAFEEELRKAFEAVLALRDRGINRRTPVVWHNYARVMPRPAPAMPGVGPWLLPALQRYAIPPADWLAVADLLLDRLRALIDQLTEAREGQPGGTVQVADSMAQQIALAAAGSTGASGDWINEIHLTRGGYRKAAKAWQQVLDPLLG